MRHLMNMITDYYQLLVRIASHPISFAKLELTDPGVERFHWKLCIYLCGMMLSILIYLP
jgi:hypothetical protein